MFSPAFGSYKDVLVGAGDDKPYERGSGVGVRFHYRGSLVRPLMAL